MPCLASLELMSTTAHLLDEFVAANSSLQPIALESLDGIIDRALMFTYILVCN